MDRNDAPLVGKMMLNDVNMEAVKHDEPCRHSNLTISFTVIIEDALYVSKSNNELTNMATNLYKMWLDDLNNGTPTDPSEHKYLVICPLEKKTSLD